MSHDIFKPSNLIGCLENKTADSAQTRKRAIVTRPFPSPGGRGLGTRLTCVGLGVGFGTDKLSAWLAAYQLVRSRFQAL